MANNSTVTPKTHVVPSEIFNKRASDSGFCVVPCLSDSQTESYQQDNVIVSNEKEEISEDPLIDFHQSRILRRRKKLQTNDPKNQELSQKQPKMSQMCQKQQSHKTPKMKHKEMADKVSQKQSADDFCKAPEAQSEDLSHKVSQTQSEEMSHKVSQTQSEDMSHKVSQTQSEDMSHKVSQTLSEDMSHKVSQTKSEDMSHKVSQTLSEDMSYIVSQQQPKEISPNEQDVLQHNSPKRQRNFPTVMQPLVQKQAIRIWSSMDNCPLKFSTNQLQLKFEPLSLKNVAGKENQEISVNSNDCTGLDKKNFAERGKNIDAELNNNSTERRSIPNDQLQTVCSFNQKTVVKATKFFMNGGVCYLIPAKLLVDQSKQPKKDTPTNEKTPKASPKVKSSSSKKASGKRKETRNVKIDKIEKTPPSSHFCDQLSKLAKSFEGFADLLSPDMLVNSFRKITDGKRKPSSYPSVRNFKATKNNAPKIRISRLRKPYNATKGKVHDMDGKCQNVEGRGRDTVNRGHDEECKGHVTEGQGHFVDNKGYSAEDKCCNAKDRGQKAESRGQKSEDRDEQDKENKPNFEIKGSSQSDVSSKEDRQIKRDERPALKLIIQSPNSGTMLFVDNQEYKKQVDSFINRKINEHASKSTVYNCDQMVPNHDNFYSECSPSPCTLNMFESPSPYQTAQQGRRYFEEFRDSMKDLKDLITNGHRMTEVEVLLAAAVKSIMTLESQVKNLLSQFGVDLRSRSLDQIIPMSCMTLSGDTKEEKSRSEILAVNPNSITASQSNSVTSKKNEKGANFLAPHLLSSTGASPYENSLYVPNSQNTHSPQLSIGSNDMWVPGSSQAHNDVVLSQGSSQSVFHRSSQVSFSDSLTDDSEVINEFDLNFETEANEESSSKVIFQAFIEELLRDVDETDSKDKDSSKNEDGCVSPFNQDLFSSPLPNIQPESPLLFTPPQFSVSNLACDLSNQDETSLCVNTSEQTITESDGSNYFYDSLSLKVVGRANSHVISKNLCQSPEFDRLVPSTPSANENNRQLSCDNVTPVRSELTQLMTEMAPKMILARDLIKSDLLASFLKPSPVFIPDDPFGIGAETSIGEDENQSHNWQDVEVTPLQTKRGIADDVPPEIVRKRKWKKPRKGEAAKATTVKQSKKFCISRFESPTPRSVLKKKEN